MKELKVKFENMLIAGIVCRDIQNVCQQNMPNMLGMMSIKEQEDVNNSFNTVKVCLINTQLQRTDLLIGIDSEDNKILSSGLRYIIYHYTETENVLNNERKVRATGKRESDIVISDLIERKRYAQNLLDQLN